MQPPPAPLEKVTGYFVWSPWKKQVFIEAPDLQTARDGYAKRVGYQSWLDVLAHNENAASIIVFTAGFTLRHISPSNRSLCV